MNQNTHHELTDGAGKEFGDARNKGKFLSLISSSALVCNMFDPWRVTDPGALLGLNRHEMVGFESQHDMGLDGEWPHLDLELRSPAGFAIGVESKFTEPYGRARNGFRPSYFITPGMWEGLPETKALARNLAEGNFTYLRLGAAQLIKHALGLRRTYGPTGFLLLYVWYRLPGPEARVHESEIEHFIDVVEGEFMFQSKTYQDLVSAPTDGPSGWLDYVQVRYFPN